MSEDKAKSETLHDAMVAMDTMYENCARLLREARDKLVTDHNYEMTRNKRVAYGSSTSVESPRKWLPTYLCLYLKQADSNKPYEYVSVVIPFKDHYSDRVQPLSEFVIYGLKFTASADESNRLPRWVRHLLFGRDKYGIQHVAKQDVTEGIFKSNYRYSEQIENAYFFEQNLWSINDSECLDAFLHRLVSL